MNQNSKVPLSSFISYRKGKPARKTFAQNGRYLPILTPEYLRNNGGNKMAVVTDNLVLVDDGELILLWDGSNAGEFFRAKQGILASTMVALDFNANEFGADYLYYSLKHFEPYLKVQTRGSGIPHVDKEILLSHQIFKPLRPEQSKIAEVLTAVDQAITQTETLIAKYQRIKTGLMQDLLTRGIDENGNLRDPATHEFKDSPLGQVPKEWEVVTLGEVVAKSRGTIQTGPFGSQLHAHEYTPEGMPVIMPQNILADGSIDFQQIARIPPDRANDLKQHFVKNNDIVFARRGDLSRCVPIHRDNIGLCGTGCLLVRIPEDFLSATWLSFVYRHEKCQRQIAAQAVGSTMVNLNTQLLANLIITKPSVEEQRKISAKIKQLDTLIDLEMARFNKLKKVKTGLMQDLLTGKVSVAPLLEDSEGN